jgi:hypothetical protein
MFLCELSMEYLAPWLPDKDLLLAEELLREVPKGHVLFQIPVSPIARRLDRDDVLFSILDGSDRFATVHLTWSSETNPAWPQTRIFESKEAWAEAVMKPDNAAFLDK